MHKSKAGVNFPFPRTVLLELARSPSTGETRSRGWELGEQEQGKNRKHT